MFLSVLCASNEWSECAVNDKNCNSGSKFRGSRLPAGRQAGFKPALVRRNVRFNMVLMNTVPGASIKRNAKPGLGQGLD